jgi:anti-sigma regulatory factor (Ser/Thr protein kinase)
MKAPDISTYELPGDSRAAGVAREHARVMLMGWRVSEAAAGDVLLITSELVGNAVRHSPAETCPPVFRLDHRPGERLRIEVTDGSAERPVVREPDFEAESGRGMAMVDAVAKEWGCEPAPDGAGKTVWACVDLTR